MRIITIILLLCICGVSWADIDDTTGVRCIIGEASNQGYEGMLAVADALQNRDTTRGVYGCKARHIDNEPEWVWDKARKAWAQAKVENPTHGADHWENIKAYGKPYWADTMTLTATVKDHNFYKKGAKP